MESESELVGLCFVVVLWRRLIVEWIGNECGGGWVGRWSFQFDGVGVGVGVGSCREWFREASVRGVG